MGIVASLIPVIEGIEISSAAGAVAGGIADAAGAGDAITGGIAEFVAGATEGVTVGDVTAAGAEALGSVLGATEEGLGELAVEGAAEGVGEASEGLTSGLTETGVALGESTTAALGSTLPEDVAFLGSESLMESTDELIAESLSELTNLPPEEKLEMESAIRSLAVKVKDNLTRQLFKRVVKKVALGYISAKVGQGILHAIVAGEHDIEGLTKGVIHDIKQLRGGRPGKSADSPFDRQRHPDSPFTPFIGPHGNTNPAVTPDDNETTPATTQAKKTWRVIQDVVESLSGGSFSLMGRNSSAEDEIIRVVETKIANLNFVDALLAKKLFGYVKKSKLFSTHHADFSQVFRTYTGVGIEFWEEFDQNLQRKVFYFKDETGAVFRYDAPPNLNSKTTFHGRWAGPRSYNDTLPVDLLDAYCMCHDTDYLGGYFNLLGDYKLMSRILHNLDKFSMYTRALALQTVIYFGSVGVVLGGLTNQTNVTPYSAGELHNDITVDLLTNPTPDEKRAFYADLSTEYRMGHYDYIASSGIGGTKTNQNRYLLQYFDNLSIEME